MPQTVRPHDTNTPSVREASLARELMLFSVPLILGGLLQQLYNWVDAFIVGNLVGEDALAAIGATVALTNLFIFGMVGFTSGINILAARHYGGGNLTIQKYILYTFSLVVFLAVALLAAMAASLAGPILTALATPADIYGLSGNYLRIVLCGMPFLALYNVYAAVLRGMGDSKSPLYAIIVSAVTNIGLDLLFVGVFAWGVTGAAVATFTSQAAMAVYTVFHSLHKYPVLRFAQHAASETAGIGTDGTATSDPKFRRDILRAGCALALPITIQSVISALGSLVLQNFMNHFGTMTVAAITTAYRVDMVLLLPIVNLGTGVSTLTSQSIGAGDRERARRCLIEGSRLVAAIAVVLTALIILFGRHLILLFGVGKNTAALGASFFLRLGSFYVIFGLATAFRGYLEGTGDVLFSGMNGILSLLLRIVLSYALVGLFDNMVIAYAEGFSWCFMLLLYLYRYYTKLRRP